MDPKPEALLKQIVGVACAAVLAMVLLTLWLRPDTHTLANPSRGRIGAAGGIVVVGILVFFLVRRLMRRR